MNIAILDALPIGAVLLNARGEVIHANNSSLSILGVESNQILGESCAEHRFEIQDLKGRRVYNLPDLFSKLIKEGSPALGLRGRLLSPTGSIIYVMSNVTPLFEDRESIGAICTLEKIREDGSSKKDTERLQEAVRRAQRVESIGRLAGGVAHNLNNILSPVIGYSDMALEQITQDDPLYEQLEDIRAATERATELVRQLLAFARKQSFELQSLDLGLVVRELQTILRQTVPESIELDLTGCAPIKPIKADLSQVQQIVIALLLNAAEAIERSGTIAFATEDVTVDAGNAKRHRDVKPGIYARLTVTDSGRGMSNDTIAHVFEPFFTTKEVGQGYGLGLSTVYGIVKQHEGSITVDSRPGGGTRVSVYLPRTGRLQRAPTKKPSRPPAAHTQNETILVVEDEDSLLKFTSIVLKKSGYKVYEASSGEEALEIAGELRSSIDLLLTDVIMPGMNGKEIYVALKKSRPEMKILYTSGYPDDVISRHGIVDKDENLLTKPTTVDKLTKKVREVLDDG